MNNQNTKGRYRYIINVNIYLEVAPFYLVPPISFHEGRSKHKGMLCT